VRIATEKNIEQLRSAALLLERENERLSDRDFGLKVLTVQDQSNY
jgi:hypothetical protein